MNIYKGKDVALTASSRGNAVIDAMISSGEIIGNSYNGNYYISRAAMSNNLEAVQIAINIADSETFIRDTVIPAHGVNIAAFNAAISDCCDSDVVSYYHSIAPIVLFLEDYLRGVSTDMEDETLKQLRIIN